MTGAGPGATSDPAARLAAWLKEARDAGVPNPDAMALATASATGEPTVRFVLLRGFDDEGLVFYTSYASPKAAQLDENPAASVVFYWPDLGRQVRVCGPVERTPDEVSAAYFATRPRGHQLAAWSSNQSEPIAGADALAARFVETERRFDGEDVPLPPFWGGYRLRPSRYEFWEERPNRQHHRVQVDRDAAGGWRATTLQP